MLNKIAFAIGYAGRKTADYLTTDGARIAKEIKMSYEAGTKGYAPKITKKPKTKTKHSKELRDWAAQNNWVLPE